MASRTRLPVLFRHGKNLGEKQLLNRTEKLIRRQVILARSRAPQHANVQNDNFRGSSSGPLQGGIQRIESIIIAHRHKNAARCHPNIIRRQVGRLREVELIEFDVDLSALLLNLFSRKAQIPGRARAKTLPARYRWLPASVNRLTMAMQNNINVINMRPSGISFPAIVKFSGTLNSRSCGCVYRSTRTAIPFSAKLQITPNA